jgi:hypothetical protein
VSKITESVRRLPFLWPHGNVSLNTAVAICSDTEASIQGV